MKVSFLAGTLGRGGAERQLLYMLRAAQKAGIQARVLSLTRGEDFEREIRARGIPVEWVGTSLNRFRRVWEIIDALKKDPPDVVQSSHFFTNIYAGLAGKFLRVPSIGAIRSSLLTEIKIHGRYGKWQIKLPRFLIANSAAGYRNAIERGIMPEKIAFVRNVVETNGNGGPAKKGSEITFLFVGRLDTLKRPEKFVRLAHLLTEKYPRKNLRFEVAGDGELMEETVKLANKMELTPEKMRFLGVCRDMDKIYNRADILVSTSAREGTSNVILEAMAHGLPVIATRIGGTPDILDETRGILVGLDDENALVEAAEKLLQGRELRSKLGSEGIRYVAKNHSLDYLKKQLAGIYEKLTRG